MYWVLFVVLLDLWQWLTVLKSSLFSIIWQFVGHGGWKFLFGGSCGGVMALCGRCDPRVGGELATMVVLRPFVILQNQSSDSCLWQTKNSKTHLRWVELDMMHTVHSPPEAADGLRAILIPDVDLLTTRGEYIVRPVVVYTLIWALFEIWTKHVLGVNWSCFRQNCWDLIG